MEFSRRAGIERRGGVRYPATAAGGTDPGRRDIAGICDGLRLADRRDHLESRYLGAWYYYIELSYPDWLGDWSRPDEPDDARPVGDIGCRLEPGARGRQIAAFLPVGRFHPRGLPAVRDE